MLAEVIFERPNFRDGLEDHKNAPDYVKDTAQAEENSASRTESDGGHEAEGSLSAVKREKMRTDQAPQVARIPEVDAMEQWIIQRLAAEFMQIMKRNFLLWTRVCAKTTRRGLQPRVLAAKKKLDDRFGGEVIELD